MRPPRILFVAMHDSPHTARWIRQLRNSGFELHLFPIHPFAAIPTLTGVTIHRPVWRFSPRRLLKHLVTNPRAAFQTEEPGILPLAMPARLEFLLARKKFSLGAAGAEHPALYGPRVLARLIKELQPDLIHSLEFQHCGYLVLRARELMAGGPFPKWLGTNWGSDIFYFRQFPDHLRVIKKLLANLDFYSCECQRDVRLARDLGFRGTAMPVFPNTGGFALEEIARLRDLIRPSRRPLIMIKGYQHFAGRALNALAALERCGDLLANYRVIVFSPSAGIDQRVKDMRERLAVDITVLPHTTHSIMLLLFSCARLYIGISVSDAISTSMLEALAHGCFPIQTNTACADEWIVDGRTGFVVPPDDLDLIADRIRRALTDDALVDQAYQENIAVVTERLDRVLLEQESIKLYRAVLDESGEPGAS